MRESGQLFVAPGFLTALRSTQSIGPGTGWNEIPNIDAPAFLKTHSHGEFVFDWMWARAAESAGIHWYPKLLVAAPFTPVTGPRLALSHRSETAIQAALSDIETYCQDHQITNAGINFCTTVDRIVLQRSAWLERFDWQFHWHNRAYDSFDEFLSTLKRKARKNIRQERRRAHSQGWTYRWVRGSEASEDLLQLAYRCYVSTHLTYGNHPALSGKFFSLIAKTLGDAFLLCVASQEQNDLACAIFFRDETRLYGRYWGSLIETQDVHFETCYYQGIEYCIEHGLEVFEPGAQGEHKIKRGFLPIKTYSYHWFSRPDLNRAIEQYLSQERLSLDHYRQTIEALNPYV